MITSERNVTLTCHVTQEVKDAFRHEAARRRIGMSELLFNIIEEWLELAPMEQLEDKRSNKRIIQ
jgi:hypothetical protein